MSKDIDRLTQQIDALSHKKPLEEKIDQGDIVFEDSSILKDDDTKKVYQIEDLEMEKNPPIIENLIEKDTRNLKKQSKNENFVIYYVIILLLVMLIIILSIFLF